MFHEDHTLSAIHEGYRFNNGGNVAKPLKNGVLDPSRNLLAPMKQIKCLHAGLNLNMKRMLQKGQCGKAGSIKIVNMKCLGIIVGY